TVDRADVFERAPERQRQAAHRSADVGDDRERGAPDLAKHQDRRAAVGLELGNDGRRLVPRSDLTLDLDHVRRTGFADGVEEGTKVVGHGDSGGRYCGGLSSASCLSAPRLTLPEPVLGSASRMTKLLGTRTNGSDLRQW